MDTLEKVIKNLLERKLSRKKILTRTLKALGYTTDMRNGEVIQLITEGSVGKVNTFYRDIE